MPFDPAFPDYCQAPEREKGTSNKPDIVTLLTHLGAHPSQQHSDRPLGPPHIREMLDKLLTLYWKESALVYQLQHTSSAVEQEIGSLISTLGKGKDAITKFLAPFGEFVKKASDSAMVGSVAVTYRIPFFGLAFQGLFLRLMMNRLAEYLDQQKVPAPKTFMAKVEEWSKQLERMQQKVKCYELAANNIEKRLVSHIMASNPDLFDKISRRDDDKPVESGVVKYLDITSAFAKSVFERLRIDPKQIIRSDSAYEKAHGNGRNQNKGRPDDTLRKDVRLKTSAYARASDDVKHKVANERLEHIKKIAPYLDVNDAVLHPVNLEISTLRNKISSTVAGMLLGDVGVFHGLETVTRCVYRLTSLDIKSSARTWNKENVGPLYEFWGKKPDDRLNDALRQKRSKVEANMRDRNASALMFYKLWVDARTRKDKPLDNAYIQSTYPSAWPEGQAGIRKWSSQEVRHTLNRFQKRYGENVTDQRYTNQEMISVGNNNIMRRALVRVKKLALQPVLAGPLHLIESDDDDFHDSSEHTFKADATFNKLQMMQRSAGSRISQHSLPRSDSARNLTLHHA